MYALIFKSFAFVIMSSAFVALGFLMIFWPDAYLRWVRWADVESYAPRLHRRLDVHSWSSRLLGVCFVLFGVFVAIVSGYILWFE